MYGIFGFTSQPEEDAYAAFKKMAGVVPDSHSENVGFYHDEFISLGVNQMYLQDSQHCEQPFLNAKKSTVVVGEGEIYNYLELREELERKEYTFKTNNMGELLPNLYDEYGIGFVDKLNGMYAIALYDRKKEEVFLIRDRLGIKPLYYAVVDNNLIFSSELKSIFVTECVSKEINFNALSVYLELMYIPVPMTPFLGISKLPPGTYLKWTNEKCEIGPYWQLTLPDETIQGEKTSVELIESLLIESVRLQTCDEVPIGAFLSGGIDSSAITALSSVNTNKTLYTFHLDWKNTEGKRNECKQAEMVAHRYGTQHFVKEITDDNLIKNLPLLIWHLEEPCADGAFVLTYDMAVEASKYVEVVLSGAGGDELFGGYSHHRIYPFVKSLIGKCLYDKNARYSYYDKWKPKDSKNWKDFFNWFNTAVCRNAFDELYLKYMSVDMINATMLCDLKWYLPDNILFLTGKMLKAASLECRVPLLDYRLVEASLRVSSSLKVPNGEKKYLFKKILKKYLPDEVLYSPKEGFGAPVPLWVNTYKERFFDDLLRKGYLVRQNLINASKLRSLTEKQSLNADEAWKYWKILVLDIWMQLYVEERSYETIF